MPQQDEAREQIAEITKFFREVAENGCPPTGDCKDYALSTQAYGILAGAVDCKLCLETETAKLLKKLGYRKVDPAKLTLIGDKKERHLITIYPDMKFGEPTVDHHRFTAEHLASIWWSGNYTLEAIEEDWPEMNRGAVLVACWYMARYGTRTWRKRWKDWLEIAESKLWHDDYKNCPMPPQLAHTKRELKEK